MEENISKSMSFMTKLSILINVLLFGITGLIYLFDNSMIIGITLLCAGLVNILWLFISKRPKNLFFVFLNFAFAIVSFIVAIRFLRYHDNYFALLWIAITLYYLIYGFIIWLRIRKK
jgi:hypothetical protein